MLFNTLRIVAGLICVALLSLGVLSATQAAENDSPPKDATLVYVGTYTSTPEKSKGIYLFWLRTEGPELSKSAPLVPLGVAAETPDPTFLTLDTKRRPPCFAPMKRNHFQESNPAAESAPSRSMQPPEELKPINQQSSKGMGPCQLVLDKTGRNILVANYGDGTVAVLPVDATGRLGEATCVVKDTGKGPNTKNARKARTHIA